MDNKYAQGICVLDKNKNTKWAKDIMSAYTSKEAKKNVPASTGLEPVKKSK